MLFRTYILWEDYIQYCCESLSLLSEVWPIHNFVRRHNVYVHSYFPSRSHPVYPDALVLGLGLRIVRKSFVVRGICPLCGWGGGICQELLISQNKEQPVFMYYIRLAKPLPLPPCFRGWDAPLEHSSMIIWFKGRGKKHS